VFCDKSDQFVIRGTVNRASRQSDLECISVHSDAFRLRGVRLDMDGENRPMLTVSNNHR
jgi:hypothetical protein